MCALCSSFDDLIVFFAGCGDWFLVFGFCLQYCSPVVGTLLPAKTWAESHSTLCFHRDSKVSIDSSESLQAYNYYKN